MNRQGVPGKQEASKATVDLAAFNCPRCSHPLKPPVYQWAAGNLVCSSCYDNVKPIVVNYQGNHRAGSLSWCSSNVSASGYRRCLAVERMLEAVRVPCSNAGCTAMTPYHRWEEHHKSCPRSRFTVSRIRNS